MKLSWMRKARYFAAYSAMVMLISLLYACGGGGGSYEAPADTSAPAWWSSYNDDAATTLIDADQVANYVRNGFKAEDGSPVIVLDIDTNFDNAVNRIKGSVSQLKMSSFPSVASWTFEQRWEGPMYGYALNSSSVDMVPEGAVIDAFLQELGATKDTVIVLASATGITNDIARGWWTLYYWGLSKSKIKILDDGVDAFATAYPAYVDTATASAVKAKTSFSVKDLPGPHFTARKSTKMVVDLVKQNIAHPSSPAVYVIDALNATPTNVTIKGAIAGFTTTTLTNATKRYLTPDELTQTQKDSIAAIPANALVVVHCGKGLSASPVFFYFKEVLGFKNVALYDGSRNAWLVHQAYENSAAAADATTTVIYDDAEGRFEVPAAAGDLTGAEITTIVTGGPLQALEAFDTVKLSRTATLYKKSSYFDAAIDMFLLPFRANYHGNGNEISDADAAYWEAAHSTSGGSDDESVTPSAPGGC